LQELERKSLFVEPLDDRSEWYRYHQLFAEVLRHILRQDAQELEVEVHDRAVDWYLANGLRDDAIEQALSGRRSDRAASLMRGRVIALIRSGEDATANRWLAALAGDVLQRDPLLSSLRVAALLQAGQVDTALAFIRAAEQVLTEMQMPEGLGALLSMRATAEVMRENPAALADAQRALELTPPGAPGWRLLATDAIARTQLNLGATRQAAATLEQALQLMDLGTAPMATLQVHNTLGLLRLQEGQ
jgi:LuxR family maltose regulon positive regulatory protein